MFKTPMSRRIVVAAALYSPMAGHTAVTTGLCGSNYGVKWSNTGYTSVIATLRNGPSTCDQYGLYGLSLGAPVVGQSLGHDDGAPSSVSNFDYPPLQASASSSMGFVHSLARSQAGSGAMVATDSSWGDVGRISGAPGLVEVTLTGHVDGSQWFSNDSPGSVGRAVTGYKFMMGTLDGMAYGYSALIENSHVDTYVNDFLNRTRTDRIGTEVDLTYMTTVMLPTNTAIGLFAVLSSFNVNYGGYADFNNTGAIDSITLPAGYSYSSAAGTIRSSGNVFSYVDPLAAVPESSSALLMVAGLPLVALIRRLKRGGQSGHAHKPAPTSSGATPKGAA